MFASEGEAYIFYNKYARDKGFTVRKQKVRHAKHSGAMNSKIYPRGLHP